MTAWLVGFTIVVLAMAGFFWLLPSLGIWSVLVFGLMLVASAPFFERSLEED